MRKSLLLLFIFFVIYNYSFSQIIGTSFSNSLRYGTGKETNGDLGVEKSKEYLDNISDLRLFVNNVTIGFRYDIDQPPEYGQIFNGIKKRYVEFEDTGFNVRAGNSYNLFSRGLALNLFENKAIAFDNGLDGIQLRYSDKNISGSIMGGEIDYVDPETVLNTSPYSEKYLLRAANFEVKPDKKITIGASFVYSKNDIPTSSENENTKKTITQIPEAYFKLKISSFDVYGNYAAKYSNIKSIDSSSGSGLYFFISNTGQGYGLTLEYKDYRFDIVNPFERTDTHRQTRMLPIQNPPTLIKEHSFTLLSRYQHIVDFNDEVGFQLEGFYSLNSKTTFNINCTLSSRHYEYVIDPNTAISKKINNSSSFLPSFAPEYSPYWEFYSEIENYFDGDESYFKLGFNRRNEITYSEIGKAYNLPSLQYQKSTAVPLLVQYKFDPVWALKIVAEQQWVVKSKYPEDNYFYNQLLSLQLSHSPNISISVLFEYTTNKDETNNQNKWMMIETGYKISSNHSVSLSFGSERGGQICSNGICRTVLPFKGFRLSILNHI
jgi:hypothetical protein